jgi:hypothetical protein
MKFFISNLPLASVIPIIDNANDFLYLRCHLLSKPTITENQIASRIANTTNLINGNSVDDTLLQTRLAKNSKWVNKLIIHYTHENRFASCKKAIHQLWKHIFTNTPVLTMKLIIGNQNSRNQTKTLVRRNPHHQSSPAIPKYAQ